MLPGSRPVQAQHVVFEQIGELAGTFSSIHVKLTLNLTAIHANLLDYHNSLAILKDLSSKLLPDAEPL
jgi:hypothetical protein